MIHSIIVLHLQEKSFTELDAFAQGNHDLMVGYAAYTAPNPTLPNYQIDITAMHNAIIKWGIKGNRGSHADYVNLLATVVVVKDDLRQMKKYCENTTPNSTTDFANVGFETSADHAAYGALPGPSNLGLVKGQVRVQGQQRFGWDPVLGAHAYKVWVGTGAPIALPPDANLPFATVTEAGYTDTAASGSNRYIIVGCVGADGATGYSILIDNIAP